MNKSNISSILKSDCLQYLTLRDSQLKTARQSKLLARYPIKMKHQI